MQEQIKITVDEMFSAKKTACFVSEDGSDRQHFKELLEQYHGEPVNLYREYSNENAARGMWRKPFCEVSRTYAISSDSKAFASCLDRSDYMVKLVNLKDWIVECDYMDIEEYQRVVHWVETH